MREILFRGKRLDNGEWVEGYYVSHRHVAHYIIPVTPGGYEAMDGSFYVHEWYGVDPETVEIIGNIHDNPDLLGGD